VKKQGFSIIELVLAILMAAVISLSLFQLLTSTRKSVKRITDVIEVDLPFMAFYSQLERDILGMFAPRSSVALFAEKLEKEAKEAKGGKGKKEEEGQEKKGKEEQKPRGGPKVISPVFSLGGKGDSFFLSFITTGAIVVLDKDGKLVPAPSTRRVAFVIEKDPQRQGVLRLMYRFSTTELSADALKKPNFSPSYELISGIKQLEIECTLIEFVGEEKEKKKAAPQEDKKGGGMTVIKEWNESEIFQKYKSLIPAYVRLRGSLADLSGREYPFDFLFKIPAYNPYKPKKQKELNIFERLQEVAGGFGL
jgi:hypothetical protein